MESHFHIDTMRMLTDLLGPNPLLKIGVVAAIALFFIFASAAYD